MPGLCHARCAIHRGKMGVIILDGLKRKQLHQLVDKLAEDKLNDAIKTVKEIMERIDYAQYYHGMPMLDPDNYLHLKRLIDMVDGLDSAALAKRPILKLVEKE